VRKIKEVLRLKFEVGLGLRAIARSCSIGLGTAHEYLQRAEAAKITWPLAPEWDDDRLEAALFGGPPRSRPTVLPMPDFADLHRQRQQHSHVTQQLRQITRAPDGTRLSLADQVYCVNQSADHQRARQGIQPVSRHAPFAGADPVLVVLHLLFEAVEHQDLLAIQGNWIIVKLATEGKPPAWRTSEVTSGLRAAKIHPDVAHYRSLFQRVDGDQFLENNVLAAYGCTGGVFRGAVFLWRANRCSFARLSRKMTTQTSAKAVENPSRHTGMYGIATIAGVPYDPSGDGGPATHASISFSGVAFRDGMLYLTDGARIRRISAEGTITTVAGRLDPVLHQPIPGFSGDLGPALGAQLRGAFALEFDAQGNLYIADLGNNCVRKVTARVVAGIAQPIDGTEIITTIAGTGTISGNSGENVPATSAKLSAPRGLAIDPGSASRPGGALYIADQVNSNIRRVDANGTITTVAGSGTAGFMDGPAATAMFNFPAGVTVDPDSGDVYIADTLNSRIRKLTGGNVVTIAGTGVSSASGNLNEGGQATAANVRAIKVRIVDGILYFVDSGVGMVRLINLSTGIVTTLAGTGLPTYTGAFPPVGDGGPALAALFGSGPAGVQDSAFDNAGNLFVADGSTRRVRLVANASGPVTIFGQTVAAGAVGTVAGPPAIMTFVGDGGPATEARLFSPSGIAFDPGGSLYISDGGNNRVRQIAPDGSSSRTIATVAGNGNPLYSGVPGPALAAQIMPGSLARHDGDLYVGNNSTRILEVAAGAISLIANTTGASTPPPPNGTPAVEAHLGASSLVFDYLGNLYSADSLNNRIWKIDAGGNVTCVVGGGTVFIDGVTVPSAMATQVKLFGPASVAFDPLGIYTPWMA
jgi:sugar lactone lactonase YvrE